MRNKGFFVKHSKSSTMKDYVSPVPNKSGLLKRKKDKFSFNTVFFAPVDTGIPEREQTEFKKLIGMCSGQLRVLNGLAAIESSVSGEE